MRDDSPGQANRQIAAAGIREAMKAHGTPMSTHSSCRLTIGVGVAVGCS